MQYLPGVFWKRAVAALTLWGGLLLLSSCGGGVSGSPPTLGVGDAADIKAVLVAVPSGGGGGGGGATMVRLYYNRPDANYTGWTMYVYGGADFGGWPGKAADGLVSGSGEYWDVSVTGPSFNFIIVKDGGGTREPSGWSGKTGTDEQQFWSVADGTTIYKVAGDPTNYKTNPAGASVPDITTVRVHYKRFDGNYSPWGVHIWDTSGLDVTGLNPGVVINDWNNAVTFSDFNNYSAGVGEVVFDIPVLNPTGDATRTALQFIIHGRTAGGGDPNNKDGRNDNINVVYSTLTISGQIGQIWLIQEDPTVYTSLPDPRRASTTDARAYWLTSQLIQYPKADSTGVYKLYYSATGQIQAAKDAAVTGADGSITLDVFSGTVPPAAADRFKYVSAGVVLNVRAADLPSLSDLHKKQLVLVQEDAGGLVQNATTAQVAGALDDLYAAAGSVSDLGAKVSGGSTTFKLWAPTAQKVSVAIYNDGIDLSTALLPATFDATTGVWVATSASDLSGKYYRYVEEVFVRGVGLVRNLVTDPYSVSLSADSRRSYVADLSSSAFKPAGWDSTAAPATVAAQTDMNIYELHIRDFSANDFSVSTVNRGKYLAFTETGSNGMKHLKALADAGLTDVHLLPTFDIASVPESGCVAVATGGAPDSDAQQSAVNAVKDIDCFNWGYDPFHYNAPEGSYASSSGYGDRRIVEFRAMVQSLHKIGLRVGMDVVYNHTTAAGQTDKSVLDRVVPGYYHRLDNTGAVETSTCCSNTATENMMMGKLMIDSTVQWATQYGIDSFRFDLMSFQPRAVMEQLQTAVNAATGRTINLIGEGWNFGEVQDGARFVQASQLSLNGSGIGTFSDRARDAVRGGSPFDSGDSLISNQGYINGLYYDPNALGGSKSKGDLLWAGDLIKVGLAGSIRSFPLLTSWDANLTLDQLNYNGQPAGYVLDPGEVVNYVENHDNQTLFDINVYRLPTTTSRDDRARVQILGAAINAFSQGVAYFHAGVDTLRSKSMDGNSYNSGDWFNRLDWSYNDDNFGVGLPIASDNGSNWPQIQPLLANPAIKPTGTEIAWTRDAFRDLLKIRSSSTMFRLRTGNDVKARLTFYNTGSGQVPTVLAGHLDGAGYPGAGFQEVLYLINVDKVAQTLTIDPLKGKAFVLHPVHTAAAAADKRPAASASYDGATGAFVVPARTAVVFVVN